MASQELTPRETQVAELARDGYSYTYVAEKLGISKRTVETHLRAIYIKLKLNNRDDLINYYKELE